MEILKGLNPAEEREIRRMHQRQRELHLLPTPLCYLDIEVADKRGVTVAKYEDRSKSWTRNFYNWMVMQQMTCNSNILGTSYGAGYLSLKQRDGSVTSFSIPVCHYYSTASANYCGFRASGGETAYGILIGTNDTPSAEGFNDHNLDTLIEEGVGSGQMQYAEMAVPTPVWDGGGKAMTYECSRNIVNNSGGTIGVNEVGLGARLAVYQYGACQFLMARDVLASTVNVPFEYQIKVKYTIQITYPA